MKSVTIYAKEGVITTIVSTRRCTLKKEVAKHQGRKIFSKHNSDSFFRERSIGGKV